ncbi:MAG TPA: DinB family protein [Pyrinomonadaceae bacterium]|jgi:uncharacterized damage-inducible protein DinB
MKRTFRPGNIGAPADEYERAAGELKALIEPLSEDEFVRLLDHETSDEDCRSAQTIAAHVVAAGYSYADYLRELFSVPSTRPAPRAFSAAEISALLDAMLEYTAQTLAGRWIMSDDEITNSVIHTRRGVTYDIEQLLEHAIVHVLRHRRQIERLRAADV